MSEEGTDEPKALRVAGTCALDRRCSFDSDGLAIDTSHVCVLVRAAQLLALENSSIAERFGELLVSHACAGGHRLMSSRTLLTEPSEMNLASADSAVRKYGDLPIDALDLVEPIDGGPGVDLPPGAPRDRDRTLVAAAMGVSDDREQTVMVVTDDEALADWVAEIAAGMTDLEVDILAATSVELLGRMHACGSLDLQVVAAVGDSETEHLNARVMDEELRQRKLARLNRMVVAAAALEAKRDA